MSLYAVAVSLGEPNCMTMILLRTELKCLLSPRSSCGLCPAIPNNGQYRSAFCFDTDGGIDGGRAVGGWEGRLHTRGQSDQSGLWRDDREVKVDRS